MKMEKSLKTRVTVLGSFVLLFGTNTIQAIDWSSWAAQIVANIAAYKEAAAAFSTGVAQVLVAPGLTTIGAYMLLSHYAEEQEKQGVTSGDGSIITWRNPEKVEEPKFINETRYLKRLHSRIYDSMQALKKGFSQVANMPPVDYSLEQFIATRKNELEQVINSMHWGSNRNNKITSNDESFNNVVMELLTKNESIQHLFRGFLLDCFQDECGNYVQAYERFMHNFFIDVITSSGSFKPNAGTSIDKLRIGWNNFRISVGSKVNSNLIEDYKNDTNYIKELLSPMSKTSYIISKAYIKPEEWLNLCKKVNQERYVYLQNTLCQANNIIAHIQQELNALYAMRGEKPEELSTLAYDREMVTDCHKFKNFNSAEYTQEKQAVMSSSGEDLYYYLGYHGFAFDDYYKICPSHDRIDDIVRAVANHLK